MAFTLLLTILLWLLCSDSPRANHRPGTRRTGSRFSRLVTPDPKEIDMFVPITKKTARSQAPAITITANGRLLLNQPAVKRLRAAGAESIVVLMDPDARQIAVQCASKDAAGSYKVATSGGIGVQGAVEDLGLPSDKIVMGASWSDTLNALVADVPAVHPTAVTTVAA